MLLPTDWHLIADAPTVFYLLIFWYKILKTFCVFLVAQLNSELFNIN